jgi:hypothetical protein
VLPKRAFQEPFAKIMCAWQEYGKWTLRKREASVKQKNA